MRPDYERKLHYPFIASPLKKGRRDARIVRETTGRRRGRAFVYDRYLTLLSEGTEPLRRV